MKRILYVGGFELPDKNAAAHRVLGNAKALRELGYEVIFLDVDKDLPGHALSEEHDTEGFRTFSQRHANDIKGLFRYASSPLHVEEILDQFDDWEAVIAYNYPSMALDKLRRLGKRRGIKVYADCTEWYELDRWTLRDAIVFLDSTVRMRIGNKRLDGVICISRFLERYYQKHTKTVLIPPLVDSSAPKWKRDGSHHQGDRLQLVYAGSTGSKKDRLDEMLRAIDELSVPVQLTIIGLTADQYFKLYPADRPLVEKLTANGSLVFRGRVSHREAISAVKSADFSLFYRERTRLTMAGFPTKFVESISCGVPVITTDTSDLCQYAHDGRNGVLLPQRTFSTELRKLIDSGVLTDRPLRVEEDSFDYRRFTESFDSFLNGASQ